MGCPRLLIETLPLPVPVWLPVWLERPVMFDLLVPVLVHPVIVNAWPLGIALPADFLHSLPADPPNHWRPVSTASDESKAL